MNSSTHDLSTIAPLSVIAYDVAIRTWLQEAQESGHQYGTRLAVPIIRVKAQITAIRFPAKSLPREQEQRCQR